MNIYHSIEDFNPVSNAVVTSGTFDGVHLGHQKIIHRLNEIAARVGGSSVVITYWPHPRLVLFPDDTSLKLLNTFEEKAILLRRAGVQHLLRIPFTKEFSSISSLEFIQKILVEKIGTKKLVIGYDHRFGKNREGSFNELKENGPGFGFEVEEIPRQEVDEITISSSAIRRHLAMGEIRQANQLLGRAYGISGRVVNGEKLGRVLGFPTANIDTDSGHKLIPSEGIYAVRINYGGDIFDGMLYIGKRPTLGGTRQTIEVNIFDFNKSIYGESLTIHLIEQIRGDSTFSDLEALRLQMITDKQHTLEVLRNNKTIL